MMSRKADESCNSGSFQTGFIYCAERLFLESRFFVELLVRK